MSEELRVARKSFGHIAPALAEITRQGVVRRSMGAAGLVSRDELIEVMVLNDAGK